MLEFIQNSFLSYGYYLLFFGSVLEGIVVTGFFVPGGLIVLLGGYFARTNPTDINFWMVLFLSWIGMFIGDVVNYYLGHGLWKKYFSGIRLFERIGRVQLFGEEARLERLLARWGFWAILYSHIVGALRSVIGFVAGASGYPLKKYILAALIASFFWSLIYAGLGYFVAEATEDFNKLNTTITFAAFGILLLVLLLRFLASIVITFFTSRYMMVKVWRGPIVSSVLRAILSLWIVRAVIARLKKIQ